MKAPAKVKFWGRLGPISLRPARALCAPSDANIQVDPRQEGHDEGKRGVSMKKKRPTEQELLKDLDACGAHADELTEPLPHESEPLEKLRGSVKKLERPTDPAADPEHWEAWFDGEGVSEDFMKDRGEKR